MIMMVKPPLHLAGPFSFQVFVWMGRTAFECQNRNSLQLTLSYASLHMANGCQGIICFMAISGRAHAHGSA